jgi:hypothetical protein
MRSIPPSGERAVISAGLNHFKARLSSLQTGTA